MLRSWPILVGFLVSVATPLSSGAAEPDAIRGDRLPIITALSRVIALSDSDFFDYLATAPDARAFRLNGLRAGACDSALGNPGGLLDCFSLDRALGAPDDSVLSDLIGVLERCTWIRARAGTHVPGLPDLGIRFGGDPTVVDLVVGLNAMRAAISAPGQGAMVASIPEGSFSDLVWAMYRIDPGNKVLAKPGASESRKRDYAFYDPCPDRETSSRHSPRYRQAEPVSRPEPIYPDMARDAQVQGRVFLRVLVAPNGRVEDIKVIGSITYLDQAAVDAVRRWIFKPALCGGKPVQTVIDVPIDFDMNRR